MISVLFSAVFLALMPAAITAASDAADNVCVTCHLELEDELLTPPVNDWRQSVHAQAGIMCQSCHGGNPTDPDISMDEEEGFRGKPKHEEVPELCAECHSDSTKMRASNLPFDQFEKYKRSEHGIKVMRHKDPEAPNCEDCHGIHKILRVNDPESPVHRNNIVGTCGGCHSSKKVMEKRAVPFNQYELYKKSVHGIPYFEKGDLGVPTCNGCHGHHAVKSSGSTKLKLVCAQCHTDQGENYKKGAHWDSARQSGKPYCADCHSRHDILPPTAAKLTGSGKLDCGGCHAENSPQMKTAAKMSALLTKSADSVDEARGRLDDVAAWSGSGFELSHLERKVTKAENSVKGMAALQHSLDVDKLNKEAVKVGNLSGEVTKEVERMLSELSSRKWGLIAAWVAVILLAISIRQRARYSKRE